MLVVLLKVSWSKVDREYGLLLQRVTGISWRNKGKTRTRVYFPHKMAEKKRKTLVL